MNRRDLFKYIGCLPLAALLPKIKAELSPDPNQKTTWDMSKMEPFNSELFEYFDFYPDTVVSTANYHGALLVFCEHSTWELTEDYEGHLCKRQISTKGIFETIVPPSLRYNDNDYKIMRLKSGSDISVRRVNKALAR